MRITRQGILERVWEIANTPPNQTNNTIEGQCQAWKLLVKVRGGEEFIASKPAAQFEHLRRLGIASCACSMPAHIM
ncbi:MAG: hypothetical protein ACLP3R_16235 [Candidatus Korobacteraceae bacterium]